VRRKVDIERELAFSEARVESLEGQLQTAQADKVELQAQVTKLQDALVSIRAPEAYRDQQIEREEADRVPMSDEAKDRNRITQETTTEYMNNLEGPLFKDAYALDDLLTTALVRANKGPVSIHGNDES
jgi:chromosome segregation ATPase